MRLVHLSDLHLGDRPFHGAAGAGDRRERDLAETFHQALHQVVRLAPDLVILSGDLFHDPDPPSSAFLALTRGVRELQDHLPEVAIVAIAGERDTPFRDEEPGPLAVLDVMPGVEAAAVASRAIRLPRIDTHVLLVPFRAALTPPYPELRPDPGANWNVLVIRGHPNPGTPELVTQPALHVDPTGWDYVAIGGPHTAASWGRNLHAAGSLERMGPNPWREVTAEKGVVVMDLAQGRRWLEPVAIRPVVELAPVRVTAGDVAASSRRLRDLLQEVPGGIAGKLVRVRLSGDLLSPTEGVDPILLQAIRARASHAEILVEYPAPQPAPSALSSDAGRSPPVLCWGTGGGVHLTQSPGEHRLPLGPGLWCVTVPEDGDLSVAAAAVAALLGPSHPTQSRSGSQSATAWGFRIEREAPEALGEPAPAQAQAPALAQAPAPALAQDPAPAPASPNDEGGRQWDAWVEASGEAEACAMEWARSRQEASSRLVAYRARAQELRERIQLLQTQGASARCPTCRRPLEEAHPGLLALLEEEWEEVVQDGTWWKRRRQQLEEKPPLLRALERPAIESPPDRGDRSGDGHGANPATLPNPATAPNPAIPAPDDATGRDMLRRVGFLLQRATRGKLLGVAPAPGVSGSSRGDPLPGRADPHPGRADSLQVVEWAGRVRWPDPAEAALLALAIEWVRAERLPEKGVHPVLLAASLEASPEAIIRLIESGCDAAPDLCRLVVVPPAAAHKLAAVARGILEICTDPSTRPDVRVYRGGRVRLWWTQEGPGRQPDHAGTD